MERLQENRAPEPAPMPMRQHLTFITRTVVPWAALAFSLAGIGWLAFGPPAGTANAPEVKAVAQSPVKGGLDAIRSIDAIGHGPRRIEIEHSASVTVESRDPTTVAVHNAHNLPVSEACDGSRRSLHMIANRPVSSVFYIVGCQSGDASVAITHDHDDTWVQRIEVR